MARGKWGNIRGEVYLTQEVVASDWKGMNVYRNLTRKIHQTARVFQNNRKSYLTSASKKWFDELSDLERAEWQAYANNLKSAYNRLKEDVARGAGNVIRQRGKLESGFNSFLQSNLAAIETGCQTNRQFAFKAPFQDGFPPAPMDVAVGYDSLTGEAKVSYTEPNITPFMGYFCKKYRVWAKIVGKRSKVHPQIVGFVDPGAPQPFVFTQLRMGGYITGDIIPILRLIPMIGGSRINLQVQMDMIVKQDDPATPPSHGATLGGDPSNVASIVIP